MNYILKIFFFAGFLNLLNIALADISINGYIDNHIAYVRQSDLFSRKLDLSQFGYQIRDSKIKKFYLVNDAKVIISASSKSIYKNEIGAIISFNRHLYNNHFSKMEDVDMMYTYINTKLGRLELGSNRGAGATFEMYKASHIKGLYGIEGDWANHISTYISILDGSDIVVPKVVQCLYLWRPTLPSNQSTKCYHHAKKITFYTKPIKDLIVGVSYIPDLDHANGLDISNKDSGAVDFFRKRNRPTFRNIFSGGMIYNHDVGEYKHAYYFAGEIVRARPFGNISITNGIKAIEIGCFVKRAILSGDMNFGISYGDWFNSTAYKEKFENTKQSPRYYTLVLSHDFEKLAYSISYMLSKRSGGLEFVGGQIQDETYQEIVRNSIFTDISQNSLNILSFDIQYEYLNTS